MILLIGVRFEIFQELLYEIKGNVILRFTISGLIVPGFCCYNISQGKLGMCMIKFQGLLCLVVAAIKLAKAKQVCV